MIGEIERAQSRHSAGVVSHSANPISRIHLAHRRRIYLAGIVSWSTANREVTCDASRVTSLRSYGLASDARLESARL
jgi:hypothetical protein